MSNAADSRKRLYDAWCQSSDATEVAPSAACFLCAGPRAGFRYFLFFLGGPPARRGEVKHVYGGIHLGTRRPPGDRQRFPDRQGHRFSRQQARRRFPQIDGLVIKTVQGLRFAPIETVADVDRNGTVALTMTPKRAGAARRRGALPGRRSLRQADRRRRRPQSRAHQRHRGRRPAARCAWSPPTSASRGLLRRLGRKSFGKRFTPAIYRRVPALDDRVG